MLLGISLHNLEDSVLNPDRFYFITKTETIKYNKTSMEINIA